MPTCARRRLVLASVGFNDYLPSPVCLVISMHSYDPMLMDDGLVDHLPSPLLSLPLRFYELVFTSTRLFCVLCFSVVSTTFCLSPYLSG